MTANSQWKTFATGFVIFPFVLPKRKKIPNFYLNDKLLNSLL